MPRNTAMGVRLVNAMIVIVPWRLQVPAGQCRNEGQCHSRVSAFKMPLHRTPLYAPQTDEPDSRENIPERGMCA